MKFIVHYISLLLVFLFITTSVFSQGNISSKVTEYGIYNSVGVQDEIATPETAAGYSTIGDFEIITTTDHVPLAKGVAFGFKWVAHGFSDLNEVKLIHVLEHPPLTTPGGNVVNLSKETYFYKPVNGKIEHVEGYKFTEDFELVEGLYKFSVFYGDQEIVKKEFTVSNKIKP